MTPEISSAILLRIMRSVSIASWIDGEVGPPDEKCGILRGRGHRITSADHTRNISNTPHSTFEIDPAALIAAYRNARRARGLEVLGFYHTHPSHSCLPSERDASDAAPDGKLWLIASTRGAMLWRAVPDGAVHGRFNRVRFDLRTGARVEKGCAGVHWRGLELEYLVQIELEAGTVI